MKETSITQNFSAELKECLNEISAENIFILTDTETRKLCLPLIIQLPELSSAKIITIEAGDANKNIDSLTQVWKFMSTHQATRKSLLINLGGGMITDLGGFAASTFKRGIRYINIPTTLLAAVDAATGGKTGINFCGLKNEIGVIQPSAATLINVEFFKTLDHKNLYSGFAEMLKHALISSKENWNQIISFDLENIDLEQLIPLLETSLQVKAEIVQQDPKEQYLRKALNFGHTIGHAFESLSHEQNNPALHGYAVAWGMLCELYMSHIKLGFPKIILAQYRQILKDFYGFYQLSCKDYDRMYEWMTHDKKNDASNINFTLLANVGDIRINQTASRKEIFEVLDYYREVAP